MKKIVLKLPLESYRINGYHWSPSTHNTESRQGCVLFVHGLAEHAKRYHEIASFLASRGYDCFAFDHRGHGQDYQENSSHNGYSGKGNYWELLLKDLDSEIRFIQHNHSNKSLHLFGHSMGSLLVRHYIIDLKPDTPLSGIIICGTAYDPGIKGKLGLILAKMLGKFQGNHKRSKLLNYISFGTFNDKFKPTNTPFDWLSKDSTEVDKYIKDPLCGFVPTVKMWVDFLNGIISLHDDNIICYTPTEIPMYIASGDMDPVGNFGKGVKQVYQRYVNHGVKNIQLALYSDQRHEPHHELDRQKFYNDLFIWLKGL